MILWLLWQTVNLLEFSTTEPTTAVEGSIHDESNGNITKDLDSKGSGTYEVIPYFYSKLPKDLLAQKLREEARTLFLQKRSKELLDNNELRTLWSLLQKNFTPPGINNEQFISYDDYLRVVKIAGEKFKLAAFEYLSNLLSFPFSLMFFFISVSSPESIWLHRFFCDCKQSAAIPAMSI